MAKKIQVVVDVESNSVQIATDQTLTLTQQVRLLKQELQKVPEGTKEWTLLQQKYNETKDSLDRVNVKSKELFGTMSSLPGPIGQVSGQLDNTVGTLKTFSSLKFSDVKTQFIELGKDIAGIGKNLLEVTGITKLYTTLNNALAASFVKIGAGASTAAAGARAFAAALTATGVGALVVAAGLLVEKLIEIGRGFFNAGEEAVKAYDKANALIAQGEKLRKNLYEKDIALIKARGGTEQEIHNRTIAFIQDEIKTQKARQSLIFQARQEEIKNVNTLTDFGGKEVAKINEKYDKEELERRNKLDDAKTSLIKTYSDNIVKSRKTLTDGQAKIDTAEAQRLAELKKQRDSDLAEINKNAKDATNALLTEREQERQKIYDDYQAKIDLAKQYGKSIYVYEEARKKELADLTARYNAEDIDAFEKKLADDLKNIEDANKAKLDAESIAAELKFTQGLQSEEEYQAQLFQIKLKYATSEQERQQAEIDFLEFAKGKQKEYEDTVKTANDAIADSYQTMASSIGSSFSEIARLFEQGSDLQKVFAIIGVLINAAAAIGKIRTSTAEAVADFSKTIATGTATVASGVALLSNPITAVIGAAQVAAGKAAIATGTAGIATAKTASTVQQVGVGISAAAQIAAITSAGKSKSASAAGASSSGGSGQAPTPAFNGTVTVPAPQIGASQASQSGTLGQTIAGAVMEGNSRSRPIQAYVVGDQVSTQQQLDRRISVAAKMGG